MDYPFANRAAEDERLVAQGALFDPLTRRLLQQAGIASGMRVLDLGSGAGNVARLAAELVGPAGAVVGVEAFWVTMWVSGALFCRLSLHCGTAAQSWPPACR